MRPRCLSGEEAGISQASWNRKDDGLLRTEMRQRCAHDFFHRERMQFNFWNPQEKLLFASVVS